MNDMKIHLLLVGHIMINGENTLLANKAAIYKNKWKFAGKAWWLIMRNYIMPITNNNSLRATNVRLVASL